MASPYRAVLGAAFDELHPRLRAYFDAIPAGAVGRGSGVFETVGTPRRWLWPVLAVFARSHVMFPVWEREVPFTVENRAVTAPDGSPAVAATRRFALRSGAATMVDEISVRRGAVIDRLGDPVRTTMVGNVIDSRFLRVVDYPTAAVLSVTLMLSILVLVAVYIRRAGTEELV